MEAGLNSLTVDLNWLKLLKSSSWGLSSYIKYINQERSALLNQLRFCGNEGEMYKIQGALVVYDQLINIVTLEEQEQKLQQEFLGVQDNGRT